MATAAATGTGTASVGGLAASKMALCGAQWTIAGDGHEATVVEIGGGLRAYRVGGVDVLDGYGPDELCPGSSGQVLAPWPNRIRDGRYAFRGQPQQLGLTEAARHNAIHGLVNWVPWRAVAQTAHSVTVECLLAPQPGYPWPVLLRTHWSVGADGLRARHEATNVGSEPCPFGLGAHPYLRLGDGPVDDLMLRIPGRSRLLVDNRLLPIGAAKVAGGELDYTQPRRIGGAVLDTAFGDLPDDLAGSAVTLSTDGECSAVGGRKSTAVWADSNFRWWQVFSGDTLTGERFRRSVAVEPMTCPPDAFRSGRDVITLEPGQTWTGTWGIRPEL
jgi:aldose 1-epimerase